MPGAKLDDPREEEKKAGRDSGLNESVSHAESLLVPNGNDANEQSTVYAKDQLDAERDLVIDIEIDEFNLAENKDLDLTSCGLGMILL